jgi:hypothetical protein
MQFVFRAVARRFKQGGVSVKFADKPCSERMAIVQSCQVQMIKNLEVVGAFSAKNYFPEKIFRTYQKLVRSASVRLLLYVSFIIYNAASGQFFLQKNDISI